MFEPTVIFGGYTCSVQFSHYHDDNLRISLVDLVNGSPVATATVNIEGVILASNEVCIKDYEENEGMLKALKNAGIVERVVKIVQSDHVDVPVVQLTKNVMEVYDSIDGFNKVRGVAVHG